MSRIDITRHHNLPPDRARAAIKHIADSLENKYGVTPRWEGDTMHFARSGVEGYLAIGDGQVRVNARMGMLLAPLKPTIEAEIRRKLDEYFPAAP